MELRQLEAFVKVVELQSFSKAAKSLFLTQPTISSHIVSLEKELNVRLVERTTKTVKTTSAGEKLYEYAKEILEIKEDLYQEFGAKSQADEAIVIAGSTIPSQYILPELISAFKKQNKKIYFSINHGDSQYVIDEILKHKVDIGFVGVKDENSKLNFIPFYEDKLVIITPNENHYKVLLEKANTLENLLKEPIILRENGSGTLKSAERFLESKKIEGSKLNVVARINDQEIIKRSVSKGMGISIMSKKSAQDFAEEGKILMYEPIGEAIYRRLYIVFEKRKRFSRLEKSFIEFCSSFYNNIEK
ncbi:selenium metabolism-associated LysR family transcriptional regulator [Anaerocolumna aminovalerica]|jgi:DNA-binding transcriptional LysR family regulator|uniref:DNA-binding transcriptional regulator, LysR family n=1 Tax=Anaerocolumna aminovalerica TaxID=1527 RepID=A0A1I5E517_9FIRM|nr:selenium metabolism-associated LysR family transcriptional regulator [Anaerocolumna aminovalerica]MBU5330821.1 LysR family transcriptional regulator [Anaerocolumna aminovalerica]MDU6263392.1 selenium metabolism-associated LysR family transcriptional regulator [Anaerocolumna aminovalerica]SFO06654.1 DNA-binding transcriptional regulator, LysR family [Anaerocolumna aminovalerica]